ncbi:MAG: hypothetical protein U0793_11885 [Gemmataceae bacterium]
MHHPRRILIVVLSLLLLLGAGLAIWLLFLRGGSDPEGLTLSPGDGKTPLPDPRIKPAIDKGVAFLRAALKKKDSWALEGRIGAQTRQGIAGLIGLTLLECGVPADDPAILDIAEELRKTAPTFDRTYVISAALFFFNRWSDSRPLSEEDRKLARSLGLRLCAGQNELGVWWYGCPILTPKQEDELAAALRSGRPPKGTGTAFSISNSQFAMLALWGARKHGIPVRETLMRVAAHFNHRQFPDGHWQYNVEIDPNVLYSSATAAGLMALAIEKALREDREFNTAKEELVLDLGKRADLAKAFEYVGRSLGRKKGDPGGATHHYTGTWFQADAWGDLYYLWTIERLGMIYGMPVIEGKDWYDWGYPIILEHQKADGSWQDRHQPEVDTCFALLFLRRANIAQDLSNKLQELQKAARKE